MKSFEIKATEENVIESLEKDYIGRNKDIVYFYKLLQNMENIQAIAINGVWGSGKTFFVKQIQLLMRAFNPMSEMDDKKRKRILERFPHINDEKKDNYDLTVYYDAWENDSDTNPVLSIIYQICKELGVEYSLSQKKEIVKIGSKIIELFTGHDITEMINALKSEDHFKEFEKEKDILGQISDFLSKILEERCNRLFVFVDELDRCKPSFAVELLEKIKHYLVDERIIFIFSVNISQLQHTISQYYGNGFDSCRYLDRFFDLNIELPPADYTNFYYNIGVAENYHVDIVCKRMIEKYRFSLREITRFYRMVKTAVYAPTHDKGKYDFFFPDGKGRLMILTIIVPIMIGLRMIDRKKYEDFISGNDCSPMTDIYEGYDDGKWTFGEMLNSDETFNNEEGKKHTTVEQKIREFYDAVFVEKYDDKYNICIGKYEFTEQSKKTAIDVANMFSSYANYNI